MNGYYRFRNGIYGPADIRTIFKRKLIEHWDTKRPSGLTTSSHPRNEGITYPEIILVLTKLEDEGYRAIKEKSKFTE